MSYRTYIEYGYGIDFDDLVLVDDAEEFREFLCKFAPELSKSVAKDMAEIGITTPEMNDYEEAYEDDFGVAGIITDALSEYTNLYFTLCTDYDCRKYILYQAKYPWELKQNEEKITKEDIDSAFNILMNIVSSGKVIPEYQEVENGG